MPTPEATSLITHIITGLLGIILAYAVWLNLLKLVPNIKKLKYFSLGSLIFLLISWNTAADYYLEYYSVSVKPVIKAGANPWAHSIFMEFKEHIFLFLPFLALILCLAIWLTPGQLNAEASRKKLAKLAGVITIIGIIITVSGIIISGAVR